MRQETIESWVLQVPDKLGLGQRDRGEGQRRFRRRPHRRVQLISPKLINMMSQRPESRQLMPIESTTAAARADRARRSSSSPHRRPCCRACLPKYLEFTLYAAILETDAAFFAAQLVAMSNATDNARS